MRLAPLNALPESDFTVKRLVDGLPADQEIFYRLIAADLADINAHVRADRRAFPHRAGSRRSVRFAWSGDTVGQGWGIDDGRHEDLRARSPATSRTSSSIPATRSMPTGR